MTDDLVRRLRELTCNCYDAEVIETSKDAMDEAADRIEKLEAANLKQSLIKVDDMARIEKLEAALRDIMELGYWDVNVGKALKIARKALEGKDD